MPVRPARVGRVGVIGAPVAKTAVVAAAVTPGPSPVAKTAVVAAAVTPGVAGESETAERTLANRRSRRPAMTTRANTSHVATSTNYEGGGHDRGRRRYRHRSVRSSGPPPAGQGPASQRRRRRPTRRRDRQAAPLEPTAPDPMPPPAGGLTPEVMAQLEELGSLKENGILTEGEFAAQKAKILASVSCTVCRDAPTPCPGDAHGSSRGAAR